MKQSTGSKEEIMKKARNNWKRKRWNFGLVAKMQMLVLGILLLFSSVIGVVVVQQVSNAVKEVSVEKTKGDLASAYRYIDVKYPGDWDIKEGKLYKGSFVMNEKAEPVQAIAEDFEGIAAIYQKDTIVSAGGGTDGTEAIGTKMAKDVQDTVLGQGNRYNGETEAGGEKLQTAYQPLLDNNGQAIGALFIGAPDGKIDQVLTSFFIVFITVISLFILLSILLTRQFTIKSKNRLKNVSEALELAAEGDFMSEVIDKGNDEISSLADRFNRMRENMQQMMQEVLKTSEMVAASSQKLTASAEQTGKTAENITEAIQEMARGADRQTVDIGETGEAMEEVSQGILTMSNNSSYIAKASAIASGKASDGEAYVKKTVKQMNEIHMSVHESGEAIKLLGKRSAEIGDITKTITGIANQTNLLALNAAIEAARAGEQGKGFAVVAAEVRKLAEQSQRSSTQIAELIKEIQADMERSDASINQVKTEVDEGLGIARQTEASFNDILDALDSTEQLVHQMASTSEIISAGAQEVSLTVAEITHITKETSMHSQRVVSAAENQLASMKEITYSANALTHMADKLQKIMNKFNV